MTDVFSRRDILITAGTSSWGQGFVVSLRRPIEANQRTFQ